MATLVLGVSFVCSSVDDWLVTPPTTPVTLTSWSGGLQMSNGAYLLHHSKCSAAVLWCRIEV